MCRGGRHRRLRAEAATTGVRDTAAALDARLRVATTARTTAAEPLQRRLRAPAADRLWIAGSRLGVAPAAAPAETAAAAQGVAAAAAAAPRQQQRLCRRLRQAAPGGEQGETCGRSKLKVGSVSHQHATAKWKPLCAPAPQRTAARPTCQWAAAPAGREKGLAPRGRRPNTYALSYTIICI